MKKLFISGIIVCLHLFSSVFAQEDSGGKFSGYMFGDYFYNVMRDSYH